MSQQTKQFLQGFTLLELMVTVLIIAILAIIVVPSYASYTRNAQESQVQQEMLKLSLELEKHKARNYTYSGFTADYLYPSTSNFSSATQTLSFPSNATGSAIKYTISIADNNGALLTGTSTNAATWSIKAVAAQNSNLNNMLLTSSGLKCKNTAQLQNYKSCGTGSEDW